MVDRMDLDMDSLYKALKDRTRRKIVLQLYEKGPLAYVDVMNALAITNTGKLNYHLKILGDLLYKDENGKYRLTEKGALASQLLGRFPAEKPVERKHGVVRNIVLIGIIGFVLILINPSILEGFLGTLLVREAWLSILALIYGLIVPGAIMWLIGVKRMKTHNLNRLIKPPFFSMILLVCLVILIAYLQLFFDLKFPQIPYGEGVNQIAEQGWKNGAWYQVVSQQMSYKVLVVWALPIAGVYSFIGICVCEGIYRILRRYR
jgi:hypothetical protein